MHCTCSCQKCWSVAMTVAAQCWRWHCWQDNRASLARCWNMAPLWTPVMTSQGLPFYTGLLPEV